MQLEEYTIGGGSWLASAKGGGRWEAASNCRRSKLTAEGCHWVWGGEGGEQGERKLGGSRTELSGPAHSNVTGRGRVRVVECFRGELELAAAGL